MIRFHPLGQFCLIFSEQNFQLKTQNFQTQPIHQLFQKKNMDPTNTHKNKQKICSHKKPIQVTLSPMFWGPVSTSMILGAKTTPMSRTQNNKSCCRFARFTTPREKNTKSQCPKSICHLLHRSIPHIRRSSCGSFAGEMLLKFVPGCCIPPSRS